MKNIIVFALLLCMCQNHIKTSKKVKVQPGKYRDVDYFNMRGKDSVPENDSCYFGINKNNDSAVIEYFCPNLKFRRHYIKKTNYWYTKYVDSESDGSEIDILIYTKNRKYSFFCTKNNNESLNLMCFVISDTGQKIIFEKCFEPDEFILKSEVTLRLGEEIYLKYK